VVGKQPPNHRTIWPPNHLPEGKALNVSSCRFALLADIHGNLVALDAVLADIKERGGVDEYWILGDIVALGPAPVETLERLSEVPRLPGGPRLRCVRGNTERYVCTGDRPPPSLEQAAADSRHLPVLVEVAGSFAWTLGAVSQGGWLAWLTALPVEQRCVLPDGTRLLGVHAGPGRDDGLGFHPGLNEAERSFLLTNCDADLVCVGHTHTPLDVTTNGVRVVNPGSVSNPVPPDPRASYALLESDACGVRVTHHRVEYDRQAAIDALHRLRHPGAAFIVRHLRGKARPVFGRPVLP
jgi:predicted phosphodiesterase